jgi:hypothetical protein
MNRTQYPPSQINTNYAQQSPSMLILATRCFAVSTPKQHEERAFPGLAAFLPHKTAITKHK